MKGGVGKTAGAVNLAHAAALAGQRVLLWDLDPQAASTFYFRLRSDRGGARKLLAGNLDLNAFIKASDYPNLDLLPARFSFRKADAALAHTKAPDKRFRRLLKSFDSFYDILIFDCAPGLSTMSECVLAASDAVLIPTIPSTLSIRTLQLLRDHFGVTERPRMLPFFSMVDARRRLHREIVANPSELAYPPMLNSIPYASQVELMGLRRAPVAEFARSSAASRAFAALWSELVACI
jgi:chromosome partitioning protein